MPIRTLRLGAEGNHIQVQERDGVENAPSPEWTVPLDLGAVLQAFKRQGRERCRVPLGVARHQSTATS